MSSDTTTSARFVALVIDDLAEPAGPGDERYSVLRSQPERWWRELTRMLNEINAELSQAKTHLERIRIDGIAKGPEGKVEYHRAKSDYLKWRARKLGDKSTLEGRMQVVREIRRGGA